MPNITFDNPIAALIALALCIFLGAGGGGAVVALRRDVRQAERDEVDLTALVKGVAAETIGDLRKDIDDLRGRVGTLERELDRAYVIIRAAVGFAHTLLAYIAFHLPDRKDVPRIPPILTEYISERSMPYQRAHSSNIDREEGSD